MIPIENGSRPMTKFAEKLGFSPSVTWYKAVRVRHLVKRLQSVILVGSRSIFFIASLSTKNDPYCRWVTSVEKKCWKTCVLYNPRIAIVCEELTLLRGYSPQFWSDRAHFFFIASLSTKNDPYCRWVTSVETKCWKTCVLYNPRIAIVCEELTLLRG